MEAKEILAKLGDLASKLIKHPKEYIDDVVELLHMGGELRLVGPLFKTAEVIVLCLLGFNEKKIGQKAKSLTYFTIFSIIPVLAFIIAMTKGFGYDGKVIEYVQDTLGENGERLMPLFKMAENQLEYSRGGVILGFGIAFLLWSIYSIFSEVESFFNEIWRVSTSRSIIRRASNYISTLLVISLLMVVSIGLKSFAEEISDFAGFVVTVMMPFFAVILMFLFLYIAIPNTRVKMRNAFVSSIIASISFAVLYTVFTNIMFYATSYNKIYGSIATIVLGLMFMNYFWVITLSGAELCFSMQSNGNLTSITSREHNKSDYEDDLYRLQIASSIYKRFSEAKDGKVSYTDVKTLSEESKLPSHHVMDYLDKLRSAGIVSKVQINGREDCFQPAMSVEQMTMRLFFNKIHSVDFNIDANTPISVIKHFNNHIANIEGATSDMLIKDLI